MIKRKKKSQEKVEEERARRDKDWNFYLHIWRKRRHVSEVSRKWLGNEPLTVFFHHILEKEKYEDFRYLEENIILLTLQEHDQVGKKPEFYTEINKRREKLLELWDQRKQEMQESQQR